MNKDDLIHSTAEINPIYSLFDRDDVKILLEGRELVQTLWRDDIRSQRSLQINTSRPEDPGDLIATFGLSPITFPDQFKMAISGGGHEERKIRTLHSSSLISLLCFYGITSDNPLYLKLENHIIRFTEARFEVQNPVGTDEEGKSHYSNMDVVLRGVDTSTGNNVILFLESKFSEYLSWGKYSPISNLVYLDTYEKLINGGYLDRMGLRYDSIDMDKCYSELASKSGRTRHYAGGIKQMVSHFIGVQNAIEDKKFKGCDVYLGEILYKFPDTIDPEHKKFNDYTGLYKTLAEGLNAISEDKFKVIGNSLTYQDVFKSFNLDKSVKMYYNI